MTQDQGTDGARRARAGGGGLTSTLSSRENFCLQVELNIYTYIYTLLIM